ncbi:MAG: ATP-dependent Clp protease proteolytic subunit [Pseudomonadota bacterium]
MTRLLARDFRLDDDDDDDDEDDAKERKTKKPEDQPGGMVAKRLFDARIVMIFGEINMKVARDVSAQMLAMAQASDDPIRVVINSPGGHVESGDTIHDMCRFVGPRVIVIGTGWVASAGALIFLGAEKDSRFCLPNTRFMMHQPMGGVRGQATDIDIEAAEIIKMRKRIDAVIARETGQDLKKVEKDTDRNYWLSAEEAVDYGLASKIVANLDEAA